MWLVRVIENWADEMGVGGFAVMSNDEFMHWARTAEKVANKIDSTGYGFTWWIGTNEYIDYHTGKDFKQIFKCEVIDTNQAETLKNLLTGERGWYGHFVMLNEMTEYLEDE